jgi:PAS domain S-box-containing protein
MNHRLPRVRSFWVSVFLFFILAAVITVAATQYYRMRVTTIKTDKQAELDALASIKVGQIVAWLHEREGDALTIQNSGAIARLMKNQMETNAQQEELNRWLGSICKHKGYSSATLYDTRGAMRFAYGEAGEKIGALGLKRIQAVIKKQQYSMSDLRISETTGKVIIGFQIPLILWDQKDHPTIGVLVFRIDPYQSLFPLIQTWPTQSLTSETLLVRRENSEILYLNELRHRKDTALKFRAPLTKEELPAVQAIKGAEGIIEGVDYRGVPVVAVSRKIPNTSWTMVAKTDRDELYAPLHQQLWTVGIFAALLMLTCALVLGYWRRHERSAHYRLQYEAEVERQALLKHFDYLVKYANDMIFLCDIQGNILEVNDQASRQYGFSREELLRMNINDLRLFSTESKITRIMSQIDERDGMIFESDGRRKGGMAFSVEVSARFFTIENKKYLQAIVRDITERKGIQRRFAETLAFNQKILDTSPIGIRTFKVSGQCVSANQAAATIAGTTIDKLLEQNFRQIESWGKTGMVKTANAVLANGAAEQAEFHVLTTFGKDVWLDVVFTSFESGGERHLLVFTSDITDRKQVEQTLQESEIKFRTIFETSVDAIGVSRAEIQSFMNPAYVSLFGYSRRDELMNQPVINLIAPSERRNILAHLRDHAQRKDVFDQYETRGLRKDGTEFDMDVHVSTYELGGEIYSLVILRDITERKRIEEERLRMEERLHRSEKMEALGQLAGGVAHDLNNTLGILTGYSELLYEEIPEGHRSRDRVNKILQSAQRAAAIIQDLLTLARRGVTVSEVMNLNSVVADFFKTPVFEKMQAFHPNVAFRTQCDGELMNIKGSSVHMEKAVMNLVSNAAEAIPGKGEVVIRTQNRYLDKPVRGYDEVKEGDYAVLTVSDTGTGIPAESMGKIFEPFYTKKTMGRSGTGLGLAIVWGAVKDHHGYIDVQTEVGRGTTFTLYFPVAREEVKEGQRKMPIEDYMGKGESILVVDDVAEQRDIAVGMLTRLGYQARAVSGGEEAVEYLKTNAVDLLLLDMIMDPGIDGLETYRRVLEVVPDQRAIIVSGFSETERVKKAQAIGAGPYVRKPYLMERIGVAIRKELMRARAKNRLT